MPERKARKQRLMTTGIRRIGSREQGFRYRSADGREIHDETTLERIAELRIPPAWENVRVARGERSPLQAIGEDSKGRTQYLYHARFRARRDLQKFLRIVEFGEALPRLRRRVTRDLQGDSLDRDRVAAAAVRLVDQAFFRLGNERSARDLETFGLTTVRADHVEISGDEIRFDFVGKWRKHHQRRIRDAEVAEVVRAMKGTPGKELFKFVEHGRTIDLRGRHVNDYIQSAIGEKFSAKDFRTWAGTLLCSIALAIQDQASSRTGRKRQITQAIKATAKLLNNTPAVCRSSYVCPRLLDEYMEGRSFESMGSTHARKPIAKTTLSTAEKALIVFLRETIADRRRSPR